MFEAPPALLEIMRVLVDALEGVVDEYCELELPTKNQHRMSGAANWSQVVYGPGSLRSHGRPQTFWSAKVAKNDIGSECQR